MNTDWHVRSNGLGFIIMDQNTNVVAECKDEAVARRIVSLHQGGFVAKPITRPQTSYVTRPVEEVQKVLHHGIEPITAPLMLLQIFAAHRVNEARGQEWEYIHPGFPILICGAGRRWRRVPFHEVLVPWLEPYLKLASENRLNRKLGHSSRNLVRSGRTQRAGRGAWRNMYAAHRLAITGDPCMVAGEIDLQNALLAKPCLWPVVSVAEAEAFFSLTPEACARGHWADEVNAAFAG